VQRTVIYWKYGYYLKIFRCSAPAFAFSIFLSTNIKGALHHERQRQGSVDSVSVSEDSGSSCTSLCFFNLPFYKY